MINKSIVLVSFLVNFFAVSLYCEEYDFGDNKSSTLTAKAWAAYEVKDWKAVDAYTEKCITLYSKQALKQQSELTELPPANVAANYWALNDVATCYYIQAKGYKEQGKHDRAKKICNLVIEEYSFAQCWDKQGWFWGLESACKDLITMLGTDVDFEDYTSETLTRKAWEALSSKNIVNAIVYAEKCISLYEKDAKKQQESLSNFAPKEKAFDYWALNDIGSCYFIMGEAYSVDKRWELAIKAYQTIINEYQFSQCWDSRGWFWKPGVAARGKLNKIVAEQGIS